jgi:hypothetical protein
MREQVSGLVGLRLKVKGKEKRLSYREKSAGAVQDMLIEFGSAIVLRIMYQSHVKNLNQKQVLKPLTLH